MTVRVLVAEDHPMFRDALRALLTEQPEFDVVALTDTVEGLISEAERTAPDLAVVDLGLADGSAIEALGPLRRLLPNCKILVLTTADDDSSIYAALRAGAQGYLLKSALPDEISHAVKTVSAGNGVFDGAVIPRLIRHLSDDRGAQTARVFPQLTSREEEILELVAAGLSNTEIADRFILSLKTVRNHVSNVFAKLGVSTRPEAIVTARKAGLGDH